MPEHAQTSERRHPLDWNARLVRSFLHNTRLVWLILLVITVGGLFAFLNLRREGFPAISPKVVTVQTVFPGAPAGEIERQITTVIESAVKDVKGLKQTSSVSANSFSNVSVSFDESVNLETAIQDVQTKIQSARGDLPEGAEQPRVQTFSTGGAAYIFGVTNPSDDFSSMRRNADTVLTALSEVKGVKSAKLLSATAERIVIRFSPSELAENGVSLQNLQLILQGASVNLPLGTLDVDKKTHSVVSVGAFGTLDDIKTLIIGVHPTRGTPVTITDVAEVIRGYDGTGMVERFGYQQNGKLVSRPGVLVAVEITSEADVIRTRATIDEQIREKRSTGELAAGIEIVSLNDQGKSTQDQIDEIVDGAIGSASNLYLLGGLQLLFLAMLLLVNWRAALVSALAIPFSLLFTMLAVWFLDVQLNTIVLFSLILVLGLIVDPAVVMVEAIQRYRDLKYGKEEAVLESGRRYGASLFMAVLTSVIVFAPFGVVSGIFGEIIKFIPLTVVPALVASYLVPIAILPMLTKYLLRTHNPAHHRDEKAHEVEGLSRAAEWFMAVNRNILGQRWKQVVTIIGGFVLVLASVSIVGLGKVQTVQFSKPEDNPNVSVNATFTKGLTAVDRVVTALQLERLFLGEAGVKNFMYFDQSRNGVFLWAELKEHQDRGERDGSKQIAARLRAKAQEIPNLSDIIINEVGTGTPEPDFQIHSQLYDNDPAVLERAAKDVGDFLRRQPNVIKVDDGFTDRSEPEIRVVVDRGKVQAAGLSSFDVGQQLKAVIDQTKVSSYNGEGGAADIFLVNGDKAVSVEALQKLPLMNRAGQPVLVGDIAAVERGSAVDAIQRFDGQRFVDIRARVQGNNTDVFAVQRSLNSYLTESKLKELGIDSNESRGEFDDIAKSFRQLGIALVMAVVLTYVVLVLQFKSFSQPLVMLATVPLSFIGVFPALWLTGSDLGFLELLGITILVGIVENVAIFLMDYANQLVHEQGLTPREAIVQATGVRFRPILLTKLVALGGLLPLAITSEFWRGLSVVIISGIGLSGFLSLIVIPILYVWIEGGRRRFHARISVAG